MGRRKRSRYGNRGGVVDPWNALGGGVDGPMSSILALSPPSYYTMNNTNDDDGSRDSVLLSGSGTEFANPAGDVTKFNNALRYNSTTAYRRSTFTDGSVAASFTLGMFLYIDSFTPDTRFISLAASGVSGASNTSRSYVLQAYDVNTDGSPVIRLVVYIGSGTRVMLSDTGLVTGVWNHIEAKHTTGAYSFYINGVEAGTGSPAAGSVNSGSNQLFIGRPSGDTTPRVSELNIAHWYYLDRLTTEEETLAIVAEGNGL